MSKSVRTASPLGGETSPYHSGEQAMQLRAGAREASERMGQRMIRDLMPESHRELFGKLPLLVSCTLAADGQPWAFPLIGGPGFVRSPDPRSLRVRPLTMTGTDLAAQCAIGAPIGLLGMEWTTRRRNRANGRVVAGDFSDFELRVEQSFGNCPKYIQVRQPKFDATAWTRLNPQVIGEETANLSPSAIASIEAADTFFIASASPLSRSGDRRHGADASHRGGRPGFLGCSRLQQQTILSWSDYPGNNAFNTLGNLEIEPRAGLLLIDFQRGLALTLIGRSEVLWDRADVSQRQVRFQVERGIWLRDVVPQPWSEPSFAPELVRG